MGKIYQHTVIDAHSSHAFAKLHLSKVPMTAVDVLSDRVLPFFEQYSVEIEHLLTDNGRVAWTPEYPATYSLIRYNILRNSRRDEFR